MAGQGKSDLATAQILIHGEERHLDTGVYHCQQAVEKSLKAFLTVCGSTIPKTHDIELLVTLCSEHDSTFSRFLEMATEITPYATEFRYPGEVMEPSLLDAETAYRLSCRRRGDGFYRIKDPWAFLVSNRCSLMIANSFKMFGLVYGSEITRSLGTMTLQDAGASAPGGTPYPASVRL